MKILKIVIVMLVLIISVGAACAAENTSDDGINDSPEILETVQEDIAADYDSDVLKTAPNDICTAGESSFTNLTDEIENAGNSLDLNQDYKFNNETDNKSGIIINKDNFTLNGNGRTIDGNSQSRIFNITGKNVTLNNLILINGKAENGGAINTNETLTLNNVTFINNNGTKQGGAIGFYGNATLNCNNSHFIDNYAESGSSIYISKGKLNLYNADMTSKAFNKYSQIAALTNSVLYVENVTFANSTSSYSPALYLRSCKTTIINSKFINLRGNITSGAIGVRFGGDICIKNCEFINTTSRKNGGAIYADVANEDGTNGNVTILDSKFKDTYSGFGGAFVQLGGNLLLNNSEFTNNHAGFNGGGIYLSYVEGEINRCTFDSDCVEVYEGYPTYGGALFMDMSTLNITDSKFFNSTAGAGNAIYAYDTSYDIKNSQFINNTNAIYTVFDKKSHIDESNIFNNDTVITNETYFATVMTGQGLQLTLINNAINVTTLPEKFDLRDWGWTSPIRNQGWMGSCWTFGMTGALESALLKATGIKADLSENNMQNIMLRYSIYGSDGIEGGFNIMSSSYLLSWLGAFPQDSDSYDEMGKLSPVFITESDIHVQDLMFIPNNEIPNGTQLKLAILKYGSLDVSYFGQSKYDEKNPYYNPATYSQYVNETLEANHEVSVIGWDDTYSASNFLITPPGDGAWILKNSWGTDWGKDGYLYVSYYDKSFLSSNRIWDYGTAIILENTVPYNINYQYALEWGGEFKPSNGTATYLNVFAALEDDLIAGVGTYFNGSGISYQVEIFVNDKLRLTQEGVSPFLGYHTIKLNEYIPIMKGDIFEARITSNAVPFISFNGTRVHYDEGLSYVSFDGGSFEDTYGLDYIACLKAYTVADDSKIIDNKNIAVDYDGGSYFSVKVVTADGHAVGAGAGVKFMINGKTLTAETGKNGIAKIKITDVPKTYTIKTIYNGKTYTNKITVKQVLKTSKVTVKKTAKKFTLKATLKINKKLVKGKTITFKFNGKTYKVKTNSKGVAQKTLTQKVIKKLKKGKTYTFKVTYLKDTIKSSVKVK